MLRAARLLPPAAALVIAGVGLWRQHDEIATLTVTNRTLSVEIGQTLAAEAAAPPRSLLAPLPTKPPDARKVVRNYVEMVQRQLASDISDWETDVSCWAAMTRFTRDDCAAALDELEQMELPEGTRNSARTMMAMTFKDIAPDLVFHQALAAPRPGQLLLPSFMYDRWAERDPVAAAAWMDQAVARGMFATRRLDGKAGRWFSDYEKSLLHRLLPQHPSAAEGRLARLAPAAREGILADFIKWCPGPQRDALIGIIGRQVPDPESQQRILNSAPSPP